MPKRAVTLADMVDEAWPGSQRAEPAESPTSLSDLAARADRTPAPRRWEWAEIEAPLLPPSQPRRAEAAPQAVAGSEADLGLGDWLASGWPAADQTPAPTLFERNLRYLVDRLQPLMPWSEPAPQVAETPPPAAEEVPESEASGFDVVALLGKLKEAFVGEEETASQPAEAGDAETVTTATGATMTLEQLAFAVTAPPEESLSAAPAILPLQVKLADLTEGDATAVSEAVGGPFGRITPERVIRFRPPAETERTSAQGVSLDRVVKLQPPGDLRVVARGDGKMATTPSPVRQQDNARIAARQRVQRHFDVASLGIDAMAGSSAASLARMLQDVSQSPPPPRSLDRALVARLSQEPMRFDRLLNKADRVGKLFQFPGASRDPMAGRRSELLRDLRQVLSSEDVVSR